MSRRLHLLAVASVCLFSGCLEALVYVPLAVVGAALGGAAAPAGPSERDLVCSLPPGDPRRWASCPQPAVKVEPYVVVCAPETLPEWAGADAAQKRELYRRCHRPLSSPPMVPVATPAMNLEL